jgi:hypothetical protein
VQVVVALLVVVHLTVQQGEIPQASLSLQMVVAEVMVLSLIVVVAIQEVILEVLEVQALHLTVVMGVPAQGAVQDHQAVCM